jgi:hypothetical protein
MGNDDTRHNFRDRLGPRCVEQQDGTSIKHRSMNQRINLVMRVVISPEMSARMSGFGTFSVRYPTFSAAPVCEHSSLPIRPIGEMPSGTAVRHIGTELQVWTE